MASEYGRKALEALEDVRVDVGDSQTQTNKQFVSAVVYALLDISRAIRTR